MNGSFNGSNGAYRYSEANQFYREQEEARRIADRAVRCELWLMGRLEGQRFPSEEQMRFAVAQLAVTLYTQVDDELAHCIRVACAELWKQERYHSLTQAA